MLTLWMFLVFALMLAWAGQELAPCRPLLRLRFAPCCPMCGGRQWRMA